MTGQPSLFDSPPVERPEFTDRHDLAEWMRNRADELATGISAGIRSHRVIAVASEFSVAMGARPKRGRAVGTPFGTFVFTRADCPSQAEVDAWDAAYSEADRLRRDAIDVDQWVGLPDPGTVTGSHDHHDRMVALVAEWGGTDDERRALAILDAFWQAHPDARYGVMGDDGVTMMTGTEYDRLIDARLAASRPSST